MDHTEFGWLFLYVCIFGLSDYIVNKWIKTDLSYIILFYSRCHRIWFVIL